MGFKVIDIAYGIDAYEAVVKVATLDAKIPLFLFDFNVPFGNEDRAKYIDKPEWDGDETAHHIKQIVVNGKQPFAQSVYVCLTATP